MNDDILKITLHYFLYLYRTENLSISNIFLNNYILIIYYLYFIT